MIVEIKGVELENKGGNLMLVAIMARLREIVPVLQVALNPSSKMSIRQVASMSPLCKLNLRKHYLGLNWRSYLLLRTFGSTLLRRNRVMSIY